MGNQGELRINEKWVLTCQEARVILGLSRNSIYRGVLCGEIPHIRIGKRILIPRVALEQLLDSAGKQKN